MRAEVRVKIDEPRGKEPSAGIDALRGAIGCDAGRHHCNLAVLDPDIPLAAQPLARIQYVSVGDDEIELEDGIGGIESQGYQLHRLSSARRRLRLPLCRQEAPGDRRGRRRAQLDQIAARDVHVSLLGNEARHRSGDECANARRRAGKRQANESGTRGGM
jgi:hypothetical protein